MKNTRIKELLKYVLILFVSLIFSSCFYGYGDDDDPTIAGKNNTYKGKVVDINGKPLSGKRIILRSSFDQPIAEFITDQNGVFQGQGDIYNTGLKVEVKNEENFNINSNFVEYEFNYSEYPSGEIVEFPELIYSPISFFSIDITNNTGENYDAELQFLVGSCRKSYQDNIETYSFCYENDTRNFGISSATGPVRRGVFAVKGSTISVTLTNQINTITQSFVINEINQVESIAFE